MWFVHEPTTGKQKLFLFLCLLPRPLLKTHLFEDGNSVLVLFTKEVTLEITPAISERSAGTIMVLFVCASFHEIELFDNEVSNID